MVDRTKETVKGAVATHLGWVNPKNGELLVSIRNLPGAVVWSKREHSLEQLQALIGTAKEEVKAEPELPKVDVAKIANEIVNPVKRSPNKKPRGKKPKAAE